MKVKQICTLLDNKKAEDIKIIDVSASSSLADFFVVCSGKSTAQVRGLFENLEQEMEKHGHYCRRKEGVQAGKWIVADYEDIIVHIFHSEQREIYKLDTLWNDGQNVTSFVGEELPVKKIAKPKKVAQVAEKSRTRWSKEEQELLLEEDKEGISIKEMAKLHQRSESAIRAKLRLLKA